MPPVISKHKKIIIPTVIAVIGVAILAFASAAITSLSVEPENGEKIGVSVNTDNTASGNSFITFGSNQSPSGQAMPKGNLTNWRQILADDFKVNAAKGSWGSDCDWQRIAYRGLNEAPGASSSESRWVSYPRCFLDTYQKRPYRADEVLSVRNGVLNFELKPIDGQPAGANPSPLVTSSSQYQIYGRYDVRMRVVPQNGDLREYYTAFLLWPQNDLDFPMSESDFPEGSLASSQVCAFHHNHPTRIDGPHNQDSYCTANDNKQWHTYTQEWGPGFRRYYIDGRLIGESTKNVWSQPQRWQLQLETNTTSSTSNSTGNVEVDWVTVYAYDTTAGGGSTTPPPSSGQGNIMNDDFEGRGLTANNGTLLNATNSYAQINSSIPVAGFYVNDRNSYTDAPSNTVLPAFDTSRKVSGTRSARFSLQSVGRNTGGGSFYHYNITTPRPNIHTKFWWQFDTNMGNARGNPALATFRSSYSGQGLTYLRFTPDRNLQWQNAGNWSTNSGNFQYQPGAWYQVEIQINTTLNQSILVVRNASGTIVQQTTHTIPDVSQVGFFEFGALQGSLQNYTSVGSFWFDDVQFGDQPIQ